MEDEDSDEDQLDLNQSLKNLKKNSSEAVVAENKEPSERSDSSEVETDQRQR